MATLMAHKASRGGWGSRWVLDDGAARVATARHLTGRSGFELQIAGRCLTAIEESRTKRCVITDDATGQQVLDLNYTVLQRWEESAYVTLSTGVRLYWTLRLRDRDRMSGFHDDIGTPVVTVGHHLPWRPSARRGVWGNLWRFWLAFAQAADHFAATTDDVAAARLVRRDELLTLAMLGVWLDVSQNRRHSGRLAAA